MHVNTVAVVVLGLYHKGGFGGLELACFVAGMAVTHSFVDFIPSIFIGAPDPSTVMSVLPGHAMLHEGRGMEAVALSVAGGLAATIFLLLVLPIIIVTIPPLYELARPHMHLLLAGAMLFIIGRARKRAYSLILFLWSGALGLVALNSPLLGDGEALFPLLSGLFGVSTLLVSRASNAEPPRQQRQYRLRRGELLAGGVTGLLGGLVAGVLPGLGSAQSAAIVQAGLGVKGGRKFIAAVGGIGTTAIMMSIASLYLIGRARSGAAIAVEQMLGSLDSQTLLVLASACVLSAGLAAVITIKVGWWASTFMSGLDYKKASMAVICLIAALTFLMTGWWGLVVLASATGLGVATRLLEVRMSILMGCLIVPVMLYFAGIS